MSLMQEIRDHAVPANSVAIWWLGQTGYIFKSPGGTVVSVDAYLTDSCATLSDVMDLKRRAPILIAPEELDVEVFACTHNHQDHTDPDTIRGLRCKRTAMFVGPHPSCEVFAAEGIPSDRIRATWPDCALTFADLTLRGTWALPTDTSDLNHMGFVLQFADGPKIYHTGDTDDSPILASAAKHAPDVMMVVINGGFNNLSAWEAAVLTAAIKPKVAIPCHYDMFADNAIDPRQFAAALSQTAPAVRYQEMQYGQVFVYARPE